MKFSAITTILGLATAALAAPTVEISRRGGLAGGGQTDFADGCVQKGGSAYCCDQVKKPDASLGSLVPLDLTVLVQCVSLIVGSPICGASTVCCNGAPTAASPGLISILDGAQVCPAIAL